MFAWVHSGALGSFRFALVHSGPPRGHQVHWCSIGFTHASLWVAWFIRICMGSLRPKSRSYCLFDFAWVYSDTPWSCRIHSGSRGFTSPRLGVWVWCEFTLGLAVVAGLIGFRVDSLVRTYGSMGLSGFA